MSSVTGDSFEIFGGGSSAGGTGSGTLFGVGSSVKGLYPGQTGDFKTDYTLIANTPGSMRRVNLTFTNYNDPKEVRLFNTSLNVTYHAATEEKLDLSEYFHPLQSFSGYQRQTFVIAPDTSINLDPGDFDTTLGEVSLLLAKAEYYADATDDQRLLYWHYNGIRRYVMGDMMMLTGQVKEDASWKGWEVRADVENQVGYTGAATGGFVFSNPTEYSVKLTILTAN
jgi:hypothetical protein